MAEGKLLVQVAEASFRAGLVGAAADAVHRAVKIGRSTGSADLLARAVLAVEPVGEAEFDAQVLAWCEEAWHAAEVLPSELRERLLARLVQALVLTGEITAADTASRQAIHRTRQGGPRASIAVLRARQLVCSGPDGRAERSELAAAMVDAGRAQHDVSAELSGRLWQFDTALETGEVDTARSALRAAARLVTRLPGRVPRWLILRGRAALAQAESHYSDALRLADEACDALAPTGHPGALGARLGLREAVGRHIGHGLDGARTMEALDSYGPPPGAGGDDGGGFGLLFTVVAAAAHAESGHTDRADELLRSAGPMERWSVPPYFHLQLWAWAGSAAAVLQRRVDLEIVAERLRAHSGGFVASGGGATVFLGPVDLHLGIVARAAGDAAAAVAYLATARELAAASGSPGFRVEADLEYALTVLAHPRGGDRQHAQDLLVNAGDRAARLGMAAIQGRAQRAPLLPRGDTPLSSPLSPRESEVAALVAQGKTNRQIGYELVVSERTAQNHVQHILTKLDFVNRAQIAAWWTGAPR